MLQRHKIWLFALVLTLVFGLTACKDETPDPDPTDGDTVAPTIVVDPDAITIQTDSTFTLDEASDYVTVSDDVSAEADITLSVSDWGGFDAATAGTYVITLEATDEAGNRATATLTVTVQDDILAPMLTGSVSTITHLAGEEVDLTRNLTGVDDIDGTNVIFTVTDFGDYDADVAGTYTIEITLSDSAGNESAPIQRTIVVEEAYARVEMVSFEGDIIRQPALYNPQIMNGNTATGYNTAYDGHYVNVLSKDYLEWILEYAPERLGSGVGWSVIAVTNADDEIVYVRHWNSGEAYLLEGELVSMTATNWSTGTPANAQNARYSSGEMGLMMANINNWVPEGGHVVIFMNWTTLTVDTETGDVVIKANTSDMPRSMGGNYIMNSDEDGDEIKDYAIGRTLAILDTDLSDESIRASFDPANPFPIVSILGSRYVTSSGIWKTDFTDYLFVERYNSENPYDPLHDVFANDGLGNDITDDITYKIYRYVTPQQIYGLYASLPMTSPVWGDFFDDTWDMAANEVSLENLVSQGNIGQYFVVEYQVTANGHTDTAYRLVTVASFEQLELYGDDDTAYSRAMGIEQRLEWNPDLIEFGALDQTDRAMLFEAAYYNALTTKPVLTEGVVVLLNEFHEILQVRFLNGTPFELGQNGSITSGEFLLWDDTNLLGNLVVPDGGYLIVYPAGANDAVMNNAFRAFYDVDYDGTPISTIEPVNGIVRVELPIKVVEEVSTLLIDGVSTNFSVVTNSKWALIHNPALGGAGFRTELNKVYHYTKDMYELFLTDDEVTTSFSEIASNLGVPWFNNGVLVILDADGNFVKARLGVAAAAEVHADGTVLFGDEITNWDVTVYTADDAKVHGLMANLVADIPEGGSFLIFPASQTPDVRNLAIETVWNALYPGGGAIVDIDNPEVDQALKDTNGFDATSFDATYFDNLAITVDFVSTIVDQADKLSKPVLSIEGNTLVWHAISGQDDSTAGFDLYVDGVLQASNVGTWVEDHYEFDLSQLTLPAGTYDLQLRAIADDSGDYATSVLSLPVSFTFGRLDAPGNITRDDNTLTWDAVDGATSYFVSVDGEPYVEVTTNTFDIPYEDLIDGLVVTIYASGSETLFDSIVTEYTVEIEVIPQEIVLGPYTLPAIPFTGDAWMAHASWDPGAANLEGIVVVYGAEALLAYDDATRVFNGGYAAVLDSNFNVKYIVDRWGHEWNPTDGWTTNEGGWTYGANHYVSYFRPYLAEGDILIFASQYTAGLAEGTYRNHFGNALIQDLGTLTTDHRNADLASAIDPTTVTIDIYELGGEDAPMLHYLTLGDETHKLTITNALDWLAKRNTVVADGGYSGSTDVFLITDAVDLLDANAGDTLAAYATVVLFAEDGTVKAVRSIINNIEYTIAGGWVINANYTSGTVLVGELQGLIAEGDYLLIGKSSTVVDGTTLAPRNFLAYHFMGSWESGSSEIWRNTTITEDFIDPNTAAPSIDSYDATMFLALATETQHLVRVSAAEWLDLRNYTVADGGLADTKDIIYIYDAAALLDMDPDATLTTYSTVVIIGADGTVKLVRSITVGIEYLYTNDQQVDNGWTVGSYATGVVKLSEIQGVLEEGDIILIGRNSTKQDPSFLLSPRDFLAYHFIGTWDTAAAGTEIWRSTDTTQFINPNDATFAFEYAPVRDAVTIAGESQFVQTVTAADWIALRNTPVADGGYAGSTDLFWVEDAYALNDLVDTTVLFEKNATIVVFDADGNVKAIRTILNTHEWLASNDPLVDNGWTMNANYASGLVYVDELLPHLAAGDSILIGKSSALQEGATLSPRDFLAYHFMGAWEGAGSEIWRSTTITSDFIDPTTVVLTAGEVVIQP